VSVNVCLPLFGEPGRELEEQPRGRHLRELGEQLKERLARAADLLDRLHAVGWSSQLAMFDILLTHPSAQTREDAERLLRDAGLDPEAFMLVEEIEDEEE
jgi:hypothetical protein